LTSLIFPEKANTFYGKIFPARPRLLARALPPQAVRGARGRAGVGHKDAARRPHEPARLWRAGATPSRAWRWGEQPQAWPASRQAGRQGGGCAGPRKELRFIKELHRKCVFFAVRKLT